MENSRIKREKEEIKRYERQVEKFSNEIGAYYKTVREIEGIRQRMQEAQQLYDEDYQVFDKYRTKIESEFEYKNQILNSIYARHDKISEELAKNTQNKIKVVDEYHKTYNDIDKKSRYLADYMSRLRLECSEIKEKSTKDKGFYEREISKYKKLLEMERKTMFFNKLSNY